MKFYRTPPAGLRAGGGGPLLRSDEVSRHAVRLVVIGDGVNSVNHDGAPISHEAADLSGDGVNSVNRTVTLRRFAELPELLRAGDLVVVNDAATLPAALPARTVRGEVCELRLSAPVDGNRLYGVLLGPGDHRTRTEHRAPPPTIAVGDELWIGTLYTRVVAAAGRRVELIARAEGDALWQALYAAGRPVQYAHRAELLPLYAVQTAYAARPWAAEMPSAGRGLTWDVLIGLRRAGIAIASLTHAAGLSSTGDDALDRALPWPERYEIPRRTVTAIAEARGRGGRVIAVGTTVVRALEAAAADDGTVTAGSGVATQRLDGRTRLRIADGLVSGLHVPGESHFDLLSAFAPPALLTRALDLATTHGLSAHELGDACLILFENRSAPATPR